MCKLIRSSSLESVSLPGQFLGYMSDDVIREFDLTASKNRIAVGSSIIDAHAGVLAMLVLYSNRFRKERNITLDIETIFASIAGTSTCHMVLNKTKTPSVGIWGPYFDVVLKNYYVREPGQTATGKLLEHIVKSHPDFSTIYQTESLTSIYKKLNEKVLLRRSQLKKNTLHVNPSFHGNRCPLADPFLKGTGDIFHLR